MGYTSLIQEQYIWGWPLQSFLFFKEKNARKFLIAVLFCGLIGVILKPEILRKIFLISFETLGQSINENYAGRIVIWEIALAAIGSNPFFGVGMGNFEFAYYLNQHPFPEWLQYLRVTRFAHNDYLQVLAEYGAAGVLLLGLVFILLRNHMLKFDLKNPRQRFGVSVIILYLVSSLVNFNFFLPLTGVIFFISLAFVFNENLSQKKSENKKYAYPMLLIGLGCVFQLGLLSLGDYARDHAKFSLAQKVMPWDSRNWYASAVFGISNNQIESSSKRIISELNHAIKLEPTNAFYWARKAKFLLSVLPAQLDEIEFSLKMAMSLAPSHAPFLVDYGLLHLLKRIQTPHFCITEKR